MQAEMLDSIVPNSLQLFEDKGFKVRVVMRLCDPWFVAKDACDCLEIINVSQACQTLDEDEKGICKVDTLGGSQDMMLISESGLYTLIMRSNKPEAKVFRKWVTSEVLPSIRKTGSYSVSQPTLAIPKTLPEALRAYADEVERREAAEKRALTAEVERDEAVRTRAMIGSRREATAMNTASQKSKECKRLTIENAELKDAVGRGTNWCTVSMMKSEWKREFGHEPDWRQLKKFSADFPTDMQPVKDVEEKVVIHNGGEKVSKVNRYHREAWAKYREYEEGLRADSTIKGSLIVDDNIEIAGVF